MYIEVVHDTTGNIVTCYCADTLPVSEGEPIFTVQGGLPEGFEQARINLDTLTAMEIEAACGQRAVVEDGQPKIVTIERSVYVAQNYRVDVETVITPPAGLSIPAGIKIRRIVKI